MKISVLDDYERLHWSLSLYPCATTALAEIETWWEEYGPDVRGLEHRTSERRAGPLPGKSNLKSLAGRMLLQRKAKGEELWRKKR